MVNSKGMTKQREVDRILIKYTKRTGADLDVVKQELSEAGVVIRVDKELPTRFLIITRSPQNAYEQAERDMLTAGYVATIPLIEEK